MLGSPTSMRKPWDRDVRVTDSFCSGKGGITHWLEGGNLTRLGRDVVDEDTTLGLGAEPVVELEGGAALGDTLVAAVASLEVEVGGPVVGEVIGEGACGAGGVFGNVVGGHGDVEGVSADDLVDMRRGLFFLSVSA